MYDAVKHNGVPVAYKVFEGSVFNVTVDWKVFTELTMHALSLNELFGAVPVLFKEKQIQLAAPEINLFKSAHREFEKL